MQADLYDGLVLLGMDYMQEKLNFTRREIILNIPKYSSYFLKRLAYMFMHLRVLLGSKTLASFLLLPRYNLKYINRNGSRGGYCNVCDRHFFRLRPHLSEFHRLSSTNISLYMGLFPELQYFMPKDYREVEKISKNIHRKFIKPKKKQKFEDPVLSSYSKDTLEESNCFICGECGKIVRKRNKHDHIKGHELKEITECTICNTKMTKKQYKSHSKACEKNALSSI